MFKRATKTSQGGSGVEMSAPILDPGSYPARVVQIIDLGMQPGSTMYPEPKLKMEFRFELLDEFMVDKEGAELDSKPRWFSYELTYNADGYMGDRSNIYKVFDALGGFEKDLPELLNTPCMLSIAKALKADGKTEKNKITGVAAMREKDKATAVELKNPTLYFSMMDPDMEAWAKLSSKGQYSQQNKIKTSLELHLTPLAKLINPDGAAPVAPVETKTEAPVKTEAVAAPVAAPQGGAVDTAEDVFD